MFMFIQKLEACICELVAEVELSTGPMPTQSHKGPEWNERNGSRPTLALDLLETDYSWVRESMP